MPKITIDGQEVEALEGGTILQAARQAGVEIPVFCYHERLRIAGNCRMCLVEVEGAPKPVASCAMPVAPDMKVHTKSEMAQKAQKGALEFLLAHHPLDCPICDQGGECDLQDITMAYGRGTSRYEEPKRAVADKDMGPLVKTHMTRCIHCTRCVRFVQDVAGIQELGGISRGEDMEITTYLDKVLTTELSGNVIDLCPVGALTSRPYAYKGRPWDLTKTDSIDVMDALGSHIRVDTAYLAVQRILPRLKEEINEEWLGDKTRFACDGLKRQRLDTPYRRTSQGRLEPCTWEEAFDLIAEKVDKTSGNRMAALTGDLVDTESQMVLLDLMRALGSPHTDCRQDGAVADPQCRASYVFNSGLAGVDTADFCLLVNTRLRLEAPLLAARLRRRYGAGGLTLASLGGKLDARQALTMPVEDLGDTPQVIEALLSGSHKLVPQLKKALKPMIIIGQEALTRRDSEVILGKLRLFAEKYNLIKEGWCGFNVLQKGAARVGGLDVGFVPGDAGWDTSLILQGAERGDLDLVYLLGADEIDMTALKKTFVIYQGHHGDQGAHHADVILPGAAYTEKSATYVNTEGRVQRTRRALAPPGDAREDWRILSALAQRVGVPQASYATVEALRDRMVRSKGVFSSLDRLGQNSWGSFGEPDGDLSQEPFTFSQSSYYMTDVISRSSETMAACRREIEEGLKETQGKGIQGTGFQEERASHD